MMAADTMEALGFERGQYVIKVNNRKVLDGVMEAIGLGGEENAGRRLAVLRAIDKLDRLGMEGVRQLLGEGREDESGDFTKGAGLTSQAIDRLESLYEVQATEGRNVHMYTPSDLASEDDERPKGSENVVGSPEILRIFAEEFADSVLVGSACRELEEISNFVRAAGYGTSRIRVDTSVVRGLEYYTGPVFEAQLTFEVPNEKGQPVVFGSVGGGGRYDGLVGRFRGEDVPATGFSVGVSRLAAALKAVGKLGDGGAAGPVVVTVMDRDKLAEYQRMVADLRNAGVAAEMYLGASGMKAQLKYADRRNAPAAIIAGSQEFESGRLQVKDLVAGKEQAAAIEGHEAWRDERPGQFEIAAGDLVAEVKKLLLQQKRG
jgi:histidyl-tRNA synthetase